MGHQHCSLCIEGQLKQINLTTKEKLLSHQINLILLNLTLKQISSILNLTVGGNNGCIPPTIEGWVYIIPIHGPLDGPLYTWAQYTPTQLLLSLLILVLSFIWC